MKSRRSSYRSKSGAVAPYYPVAPKERNRREISQLLGFDYVGTQRRGWQWLVRHGFLHKDALGNLLGIPESARPEVGREKANALDRAIQGITSTEFMYGPERLAGRRWHGALEAAIAALEAFRPFAQAREVEDSDFAGHSTGGSYDKVLALTLEIAQSATQLVTKMQEAKRQIRIYKDDPLPGLERGRRPHLGYLARLEASLSVAGFTNEEIASIVWDTNRIDDHRRKARRALTDHVERIRKRAARFKPGIILRQRIEKATDVRMAEFLKRTRRPSLHGRNAFVAWMESPEAKALERDSRRLRTKAKTGK